MFVQQVGNHIVSQPVATSQTEWDMGESFSHHLVFHHTAIQLQFYSLPTFHECFLLDGLLYSPRNLEVLPKTTKKKVIWDTSRKRYQSMQSSSLLRSMQNFIWSGEGNKFFADTNTAECHYWGEIHDRFQSVYTTGLWNYAFTCTEFCIKNKNSPSSVCPQCCK